VTPEQRQRRMLAVLPLLLQEGRRVGDLFGLLARVLSGEREDGGMEYGVTRVLRSRWHALADGWGRPGQMNMSQSELARLGALFGFAPAKGETDDRFRRRLLEFVAVHRAGLTTAPAILRLIALAYEAEDAPDITWTSNGRGASATFSARDSGGVVRDGIRVELVENPTAASDARFSAIAGDTTVLVRNGGLDACTLTIDLIARDAPVHAPALRHAESGEYVIYAGVVPAGQTLTLRYMLPPLLDGIPQDVPVLMTNPTVFDGPDVKFDAALFSSAKRDSTLPLLVPGDNRWHYDTLTELELLAFLAAWPGLTPLAKQALPQKVATSVGLEFRWRETVPATFALRVPADFVPLSFAGDLSAFVRELERVIDYGRATGIRARVELALPHVEERLTLSDSLSFETVTYFADDQPIDEQAPPPEIGILLFDKLPEPGESLVFEGHFNATYFDTSIFAEPETEP
jgi:hypothetical protein